MNNENSPEKKYGRVGSAVRKVDSIQLLTGKPMFLNDMQEPEGTLTVKLLRSPHAHAIIKNIDIKDALLYPGVVAIYTYEDVPKERFTEAGQKYPETSPHDRLILDKHIRHVGEPVAIIAAEDENTAEEAMKLIKVEYEILEAVIDFHKAIDNPVIIHPEDDWHMASTFITGNPKRNICTSGVDEEGNTEEVLKDCDIVTENSYHIKATNQMAFETFRTFTRIDEDGRLYILSSTQIVFHVRRIVAHALGIEKSQICVEKVRIGGGFGSKQTAVSEIYPAFVTWKTKRPAKIVYTRREYMEAGSPRHEMEVNVRLGAMKDGVIRAVDMQALSNTGAYGEHGWATVHLTGHKSIPLYTGSLEAYRFIYNVVYTNRQSSGACRGFGATQGIFAVETAVNELAETYGIDPLEIRLKNCVKEGQEISSYNIGEIATSCNLEGCLRLCADKFGWKEKYPVRTMPDGKIRAAGVAMAMQGSGIAKVDIGSATIKLEKGGNYTLFIGAADMGTGCDTILSQMLCDCMDCPFENIRVFGANTDRSPYDSGSYASSTTYVTGTAVVKAAEDLQKKMMDFASVKSGIPSGKLVFENNGVRSKDDTFSITAAEIARELFANEESILEATFTNCSPTSPPPFMAGMVEIELDPETGKVNVLNYTVAIDCGTVINPALARVQAEGGIVQGIGMALYEDINYSQKGALFENSLMTYRIPTRLDTGNVEVYFCPSHEESGPFGAKSIGEIVINTPGPAITHAIYRATGKWFRTLPILPEKIAMSSGDKE